MKLYNLTFSPTGGTRKVADILCQGWDCSPVAVDLCDAHCDFTRYHFEPDDVCFVSAPSYGGLVPQVVLDRLLQMNGGRARAIPVAVYGNRAFEDTLIQLRDTLHQAGFRCVAGVAAVAEHSIMRQYATGRPDARDMAQLTEFAGAIRKKLAAAPNRDPAIPGNVPYKPFHVIPMFPAAGDDCVLCGQCAALCPVEAIPLDAPNQTDATRCICCMRCVAVCPHHARRADPARVAATSEKLRDICSVRKENELFL